MMLLSEQFHLFCLFWQRKKYQLQKQPEEFVTYCGTLSGQLIGRKKKGLLRETELESRAVHKALITFLDPQFKIYSAYSPPTSEGQSRTQQAHPFE